MYDMDNTSYNGDIHDMIANRIVRTVIVLNDNQSCCSYDNNGRVASN